MCLILFDLQQRAAVGFVGTVDGLDEGDVINTLSQHAETGR